MEQTIVFKWEDISGMPKESNKEIYKKIVDEINKECDVNIGEEKHYIVKNFAKFVEGLSILIKNKKNYKEWWNRFLNNHIKYMKHSLIVKENFSNSDLSFNLALEHRLYDSACYQCFDLMELQINDLLDDKLYFSKIYAKLRYLANKNISLVNDIYSWAKDHYDDNLTNLIIDRVAKEKGSLVNASTYLIDIINNDIIIFDQLSKSINDNHPSLQKLIFMLKWNMVSHWNWALNTNRYKHKFSLLPEFLI